MGQTVKPGPEESERTIEVELANAARVVRGHGEAHTGRTWPDTTKQQPVMVAACDQCYASAKFRLNCREPVHVWGSISGWKFGVELRGQDASGDVTLRKTHVT